MEHSKSPFCIAMANSIRYKNQVNPLKGSGVRWLHFEVFSAIQV